MEEVEAAASGGRGRRRAGGHGGVREEQRAEENELKSGAIEVRRRRQTKKRADRASGSDSAQKMCKPGIRLGLAQKFRSPNMLTSLELFFAALAARLPA